MITYAIGCLQPGLDYFQAKVGNKTQNPVTAFKAARLFSTSEIEPTAADSDDRHAVHFLISDIPQLKAELPTYLALAADVDQILKCCKNLSDPESSESGVLAYWSSSV